jgi:hypothetical protein
LCAQYGDEPNETTKAAMREILLPKPSEKALRMRKWRQEHPGEAYAQWKESRKKHPESRARATASNYAKGAAHLTLAERASRRRWTEAEDARVLAHTIPDRELAVQIRRGVKAIQLRRAKLRKRS